MVESASSNSSLDICVESTARMDKARVKIMSEAAERDQLGDRIAEVAVCAQ